MVYIEKEGHPKKQIRPDFVPEYFTKGWKLVGILKRLEIIEITKIGIQITITHYDFEPYEEVPSEITMIVRDSILHPCKGFRMTHIRNSLEIKFEEYLQYEFDGEVLQIFKTKTEG